MSAAPSMTAPANSIPPGAALICDLTLGVSLGVENPKFVTPSRVTNRTPRDLRIDRGYNRCTGI
jgi:hypothetical protein